MKATIGLLGDVMLGRGVAERLGAAHPSELWSPEIRAITSTFDLTIANMECCISERGQPTELIRGKPFFFRGPQQNRQTSRDVKLSEHAA